jgi:hypothetical protein
MIIAKISGGLGNQMFQFAAGFALSLEKKTIVGLDLSSYKSYELHNGFELSRIFCDSNFREVQESEINAFLFPLFYSSLIRLFKIPRSLKKLSKHYFTEEFFDFNETFFEIPDNSYLDGYWQSYLYFQKFSNQIREVFLFPKYTDYKNISINNQILSSKNSVSIHFRRGDYVTNIKTNTYHGICDLKYYEKAINFFLKKKMPHTFFIFSDDIRWVKKNLNLKNVNHIYVNHNSGPSSFNDMSLMSLCNHNIVANSTFSWWGAWLNSNPKKIVIYPKKWFADKNALTLCPPGWISF